MTPWCQAPWAKAPGEKVPGEKRKIGSAAARAFRDAGHRPPLPVPGPVAVISPEPSFLERAGAYAIVLMRWKNRQRQ